MCVCVCVCVLALFFVLDLQICPLHLRQCDDRKRNSGQSSESPACIHCVAAGGGSVVRLGVPYQCMVSTLVGKEYCSILECIPNFNCSILAFWKASKGWLYSSFLSSCNLIQWCLCLPLSVYGRRKEAVEVLLLFLHLAFSPAASPVPILNHLDSCY